MVRVGQAAPRFRLPSHKGGIIALEDYIGKKNVVVYFYPKDFTRGCTVEAGSFRDSYEEFTKLDAEVIGISSDSASSHEAFAKHCNLPFILLSDRDGTMRKAYGVKRTLGIIPGRMSFIIDKQGIVRHVFSSQSRPTQHVAEALDVLKTLG